MGSSAAERRRISYKWALVCLGCVYMCDFVRNKVFLKSTENQSRKGKNKMHEQNKGSSSCLWLQKYAMKFVAVIKKLVKPRVPKKKSSGSKKTRKNSNVLIDCSKFKKFDIVEDYSDHYYKESNSEKNQPIRNWAKKIQEEWRMLEELPDTILVRVYESRMDLLRAVIIGAEGTPYHDGLFFFDVFFPYNYPTVPPQVYYHSGGLRINPNLYKDGRVCLSLLNTWTGRNNEKWAPGVSTMLQVLVSIQGLILNAKPYFNEPGFASSRGSVKGEYQSMLYNEDTLIYSLKTMVYTMRNPPKDFKDLVISHFRDRAVTILTVCRGYIKGEEVGCCVNRGEKGANGLGKKVESYMRKLVNAFKKIGVENVDHFVP